MQSIAELKAKQQKEVEKLELEHALSQELGEIPGIKVSSFLGGLKTYGYYAASAFDVTTDVRAALEYIRVHALPLQEYVGYRGNLRNSIFHPGIPDLSEELPGIRATSFPYTEEHVTGKTGVVVVRYSTISYGAATPKWEVKFFLDQPFPVSVTFRVSPTAKSMDLTPQARYGKDRIVGWVTSGSRNIPQRLYVHEGKQTAEVTMLLTLEQFEFYFLDKK